jgi:cytochrome c55X
MPRQIRLWAWVLAIATIASPLAHADSSPAALEQLVRQDCGSCHGMTLKGGLGPALRASRFAGRPAEALAQIILDGVPGTPMPPWRPLLSEADALWIANYLLRGVEE